MYVDPGSFLPPDVWHVVPWATAKKASCGTWQMTQVGCIAYFYCDACRYRKYIEEGWTPGFYINIDGSVSTDEEDEEFLSTLNPPPPHPDGSVSTSRTLRLRSLTEK
jgi:hypothetical protein